MKTDRQTEQHPRRKGMCMSAGWDGVIGCLQGPFSTPGTRLFFSGVSGCLKGSPPGTTFLFYVEKRKTVFVYVYYTCCVKLLPSSVRGLEVPSTLHGWACAGGVTHTSWERRWLENRNLDTLTNAGWRALEEKESRREEKKYICLLHILSQLKSYQMLRQEMLAVKSADRETYPWQPMMHP